ncbi:hypothetical protein PROPEN_01000 [Proteus penneri ATCC 35198]|nr:hypothetical protein PROPEN_01000 [Proteus penneri ATCC 35198]
MKIMNYCTQATAITDFNIDRKEKKKIKKMQLIVFQIVSAAFM